MLSKAIRSGSLSPQDCDEWAWRLAAIPGGCAPDTISSDIHVFSGNSPGMPYLPWVMSKFLTLGYSLEQVVTVATSAPAKIINRAPKIGTLQIGATTSATARPT
jgi:predicted amidohydrolase